MNGLELSGVFSLFIFFYEIVRFISYILMLILPFSIFNTIFEWATKCDESRISFEKSQKYLWFHPHFFALLHCTKSYFVTKIFLTCCENKLFYWNFWNSRLKAKSLQIFRSLEQFKQWKVRTIYGKWMLF